MDFFTPYRFLKAIQTREGREGYRKIFRSYLWRFLRRYSKEKFLDCKLNGCLKMKVSTLDNTISREIYTKGTFEPTELSYIRKTVKPGMLVMDIGANIGVHTLILGQSVGPGGFVHAFEPSGAFERLKENVELNGYESRVRFNRCAVGASEGTIQLFRCCPGLEAFTSRGTPLHHNVADGTTFTVPLTSLDRYAQLNDIRQIDFIKIDTEGSEREIFLGAEELLSGRAIRHIMFEVNETCLQNCGTSSRDLIADVRRAGFFLHILDRDGALLPCPDEPKGDWVTVVGAVR